jgi:hypothetical protein
MDVLQAKAHLNQLTCGYQKQKFLCFKKRNFRSYKAWTLPDIDASGKRTDRASSTNNSID